MRLLDQVRSGCFATLIIAICASTAPGAIAAGDESEQSNTESPLRRHLARMLTGDGEWRTPNPGYVPGERSPKEFGIRMRMAPDGSHATGELIGLFADGDEATYWSMIVMYNPVTQKVITQQIGWDGALVYGETPPQPGKRQTIDMIAYAPVGTMNMVRHQMQFTDTDTHEAHVYERGAEGEWVLQREWTWRRWPDGE